MELMTLPERAEMVRAFMDRDGSYEGIFFTAVTTTGIFCRPTCSARKPLPRNVEFYGTARDALVAGFRPCKRCRPMEPVGARPDWVAGLIAAVDADPSRRWKDADLRDRGLSPSRVRRWFQEHHGMTFHAYSRARRLGNALGQIRDGSSVTRAAFAAGFESLSGFNDAFRRLAGEAPTRRADAPVISVSRITTPLGPMVAGATENALVLLEFADRRMLSMQIRTLQRRLDAVYVPGWNAVIESVADEVRGYFEGARHAFTVPIQAPGTLFQQEVWAALRAIPPGEVVSYGALAERLGRPTAVRAVARANGDNRLALVIPCHRVIGADGRLTGYGGGLWRKRALLELEGARFVDSGETGDSGR